MCKEEQGLNYKEILEEILESPPTKSQITQLQNDVKKYMLVPEDLFIKINPKYRSKEYVEESLNKEDTVSNILFSNTDETKTFILNLFCLRSIFNPKDLQYFLFPSELFSAIYQKDEKKEALENLCDKFGIFLKRMEVKLNIYQEIKTISVEDFKKILKRLKDTNMRESIDIFKKLAILKNLEASEANQDDQENYPVKMTEQAKYHIQLKEFELADELLDQVIQDKPKFHPAWYLKSFIYLRQKETNPKHEDENALDTLMNAYQFCPTEILPDMKLYRFPNFSGSSNGDIKIFGAVMSHIIELSYQFFEQNDFEQKQLVENKNTLITIIEEFQTSRRNWIQEVATTLSLSSNKNLRQYQTDVWSILLYEHLKPENYSVYFKSWFQNWKEEIEDYPEKEYMGCWTGIYFHLYSCTKSEKFMNELKQFLSDERIKILMSHCKKCYEQHKRHSNFEEKLKEFKEEYASLMQDKERLEVLEKGSKIFSDLLCFNSQCPYDIFWKDSGLYYKCLYCFLRITYDLSVHYKDQQDYERSVKTLFLIFDKKEDCLEYLRQEENNYLNYYSKESYAKDGELVKINMNIIDPFGNYGSILKAINEKEYELYCYWEHQEVILPSPSLQNLISELKAKESQLIPENLDKLRKIEMHVNHYSNDH